MNLADKINQPVFHHVGNVADSLSRPCYVVGGYVRDIFLHRHSKDIDFVTVGSGIEVAEAVAATLGKGCQAHVFRNFGTAQVKRHDLELEPVGNPTPATAGNRLSRTGHSTMTCRAGILP